MASYEKINKEKCFMLSQLFNNLNNLRYIEFKYKNKRIIPNFLIDYYNFGFQGYYMKKID